jgi:hypothetical protein
MNPLCKIPRVLALSLVVLAMAARDSIGQPPPNATGPADSAQWMREAEFPFSLSRLEDVNRLIKVRYIGTLEATLALEKLARKEYHNDHDEPHRAARVLVFLGGGDSRALAALCDNLLTLKGDTDGYEWEGGHPLSDFEAAQALVTIGGRHVRQAIFDSLRKPQGRRDLLIRAHVLAELDPPPIMCEHICQSALKTSQ